MATGMYLHGSIPRSSSTTDLLDTAIPNSVSNRKRRVGSGLKNSFSSFEAWSIPPPIASAGAGTSSSSIKTAKTSTAVERPHHAPPPRQLTPYQLQRKQMKNSFQFPNGENFTPKNRCMSKSSSTIQLVTPPIHQQPPIQPPPLRTQTLTGFGGAFDSRNVDRGNSIGVPRSQSLPSLPQQRLLPPNTFLRHSQYQSPSGVQCFNSKSSPANSTDSNLSSNISNGSNRDSMRGSSSSIQSKPTTVSTPEKELAMSSKPFMSAAQPTGSPQKSLGSSDESSNDEDFHSARASLIEEEGEKEPGTEQPQQLDSEQPQLEPRLALQVGLEPERIENDDNELESDDDLAIKEDRHPLAESELELSREEEKPEKRQQECKIEKPVPQFPTLTEGIGNDINNNDGSKKSKFGKLFRKILHSSTPNRLRKRKRNQTPSSSSSPVIAPPPKARHRNVSVTDEGSPLSSLKDTDAGKTPSHSRQQKVNHEHRHSYNSKTGVHDTPDKTRQSSLTPSLESDEDVLMDTDLVFDSLLLKADSNHPSSWNRQRDLQLKLQTLASPDDSTIIRGNRESSNPNPKPLAKQETDDDDSNVDYELVQEFSKLGNFIEGPSNGIEKNENLSVFEDPAAIRSQQVTLPPQRSPKRPKLPSKNLAQSFYGHYDSDTRLIKRLQENWNDIRFDSAPPSTTNEGFHDKSLRFAQDVYVKDTWAPVEYHRSDKLFIKDRRRMMRLENSGFINSIKRELNEYKRNEMAVHIDSANFTHFFV